MTARYSLADVAALIGEPTRAAMLLGLLDGRALTATELARIAALSAPATSLHLGKLARGGLVAVRKAGRHRYYRLASGEVAHALEALGVIATLAQPGPPGPPGGSGRPGQPAQAGRSGPPGRSSRPVSPARAALRSARTCYDHLAGVLAIELADGLERGGILRVVDDERYRVTRAGAQWFADALAIDVAALSDGRRPLARRCLDWTERRPHLAGALGAAILERAFERRWVARTRESRALRVTIDGAAAIARLVPRPG
jgi:DNA-binding transcriptional ArsR family regulator